MSNTLTLQDSINYAQTYGGYRGLAIGASNNPAITAANITQQIILSPPFSWNWNRNSYTFLTTAGSQDYTKAVSTFGFIEKASYVSAATVTATSLTSNVATYTAANNFVKGQTVTVIGATNSPVFNIVNQPITAATSTNFTVAITNGNIGSGVEANAVATLVKNSDGSSALAEISQNLTLLGSGAELGSPANIAAQIDDNAGNITFRLLPVPNQTYQINVIFQKRIPALMGALNSTWAPIPDHFSYIYQMGFSSLMMAYWSDPRWNDMSRKFVAGLLGVAEGLTEEERNIFQQAWLNSVAEQQTSGLRVNQGAQARGSL